MKGCFSIVIVLSFFFQESFTAFSGESKPIFSKFHKSLTLLSSYTIKTPNLPLIAMNGHNAQLLVVMDIKHPLAIPQPQPRPQSLLQSTKNTKHVLCTIVKVL